MLPLHSLARRLVLFGLVCLAGAFLASPPVFAAGVVGNGTPASCTEAAFNPVFNSGGTVKFNCGANPVTITLTTPHTVTSNTTIDGGKKITLAAQNVSLFAVPINKTLTLNKITLRNGKSANGGALVTFGTLNLKQVTLINNQATTNGGAIVSNGTLNISKSTFNSNKAPAGGAIYSVAGSVTIKGTKFFDNQATATGGAIHLNAGQATFDAVDFLSNHGSDGGALFVDTGGTAIIRNSGFGSNIGGYGGGIENNGIVDVTTTKFAANRAQSGDGGAIWNLSGTLTVQDSSIHDNNAATTGGGISNYGNDITLKRVTLNANSASGQGGGIYNEGSATLENVTLVNNQTEDKGGAYYASLGSTTMNYVTISQNQATVDTGGIYQAGGTVELRNTVLDYNQGDDCHGTVSSLGHNSAYDGSCKGFTKPGDQTNSDPLLGIFQLHGGFAETLVPDPDSPLIDNGVDTGIPDVDQRGIPRPQPSFGEPDIGAVERCLFKPGKPELLKPAKGAHVAKERVALDWNDPLCGPFFLVQVYQDSKDGKKVDEAVPLFVSQYTTKTLAKGHKYFWRVETCSESGCARSKWFNFTIP